MLRDVEEMAFSLKQRALQADNITTLIKTNTSAAETEHAFVYFVYSIVSNAVPCLVLSFLYIC